MNLVEKLQNRFREQPEIFSVNNTENKEWQRFVSQYPADKITQLSLEDYCLGKGSKKENFCWWIERGLEDAMGRYFPGTSKAHLIYRERDGSYYKNRLLADLSDQEALEYVLKITQSIAQARSLEDAEKLDNDEYIYKSLKLTPQLIMGEARKLRIYNAYHPGESVDINSPKHIEHFLKLFGVEDVPLGTFARAAKLWDIYQQVKVSIPDLTPNGFRKLLYDAKLALAPSKLEESADDVEEYSALKEKDNLPRNLILCGPPGTGKTYRTINKSLEILDPDFYVSNSRNRPALMRRFNELKEQKKIGFVTFHQSFSYEEFVEGLKAYTDENGQIRYDIEDGIFKELCEAALSRVTVKSSEKIDIDKQRVWKVSLGNTLGEDSYIYDECIENGYILIGYGWNIDFKSCDTREEIADLFKQHGISLETDYPVTAIHTLKNGVSEGDLVIVSDGNHKFRAIGKVTGDYSLIRRDDGASYTQSRPVEWLRIYDPSRPKEDLIDKVFSQMTIYELKNKTLNRNKLGALLNEDSVSRGVLSEGKKIAGYEVEKIGTENITLRKPNGASLALPFEIINQLARLVKNGQITIDDIKNKDVFEKVQIDLEKYIVNGYANILAPLVEKNLKGELGGSEISKSNDRVLIIDEINRGNVAKIFGELITLIESNKRRGTEEALEVTLPYSKKTFSVPDNLYIIGTMNTADRSLTTLDKALRRRFVFEEVLPDSSLLSDVQTEDGIDIRRIMDAVNSRIEILLGRDYLIGHSYFIRLINDPSIGALRNLFRKELLPLLQEYFFDDWEKIHRVLGDHQKPRACQIIRNRYGEQDILDMLGDDWGKAVESCWEINYEALEEPDAYIGIYQKPSKPN